MLGETREILDNNVLVNLTISGLYYFTKSSL